MVVIRLRRGGRIHDPHYRIVAQEKRSKLNGSYIENIGHYHPTDTAKKFEVSKERLEHWISQGAQLSPTVTNLLVKNGFLPADRRIVRLGVTKKAEAPVEAPAEAKADVKTPEAAEPAKEEAKSEEAPAAEEAPAETETKTEAEADQA